MKVNVVCALQYLSIILGDSHSSAIFLNQPKVPFVVLLLFLNIFLFLKPVRIKFFASTMLALQ